MNTVIADTINDMSFAVSFAEATQELIFIDTIATSNLNPTYCGERNYSFSPTFGFLTITGTTMRLYTANGADVGTHNVDVTI